MNNSATDLNWPYTGNYTGDRTTARPSLVRAWQGMILAAYPGLSPAGQVYTHIYDPYYGGNGWYPPQRLGSFQISGATAMAYFNRSVYFFFCTEEGFVWTTGSQPAPGNNNALQFGAPIAFGVAHRVGYPYTPSPYMPLSIAAAIFNSSVYLVWGGAQGVDGGIQVMYATAPLAADGFLNFSVLVPIPQAFATSELSLSVFNNQLYCAYRGMSGQIALQIFSTDGSITSGLVTDQVGQTITCNLAPALATDPAGQFLMAVFAESGGNQLYSSYLSSGVWSIPQQLGNNCAGVSPALAATATGRAFLMYTQANNSSSSTVLTVSSELPQLWGVTVDNE